jgi:hypothetical protein
LKRREVITLLGSAAAPQHAIEMARRQLDGNVALARRGSVHGR